MEVMKRERHLLYILVGMHLDNELHDVFRAVGSDGGVRSVY